MKGEEWKVSDMHIHNQIILRGHTYALEFNLYGYKMTIVYRGSSNDLL